MGRYQDISIKKLVKGINEDYFLPEIQREFVWDNNKNKFEDKLYDLFDSIVRGYPIGTLLFWETKYDNLVEYNITVLKFLSNSNKENEIIERYNFKEKKINLVLDGQQRMTILNLALRGVFEDEYRSKRRKRYLFFNLLSNPENDKEINERNYEFELFTNEEDFFVKDDKIWWKVSNSIKENFDIFGERNKILSKLNGIKDENNLIEKNIWNLFRALDSDNISYYQVDSEKSDEEALEIFVRVNSGGVALTYSDLLFSKIKQYWKKGENKVDAREDFSDFLNMINKNNFSFDNDFILKTSLVLIDKDIKYQVKNFNKENVELIKEKWEQIKESIKIIVDFLENININSKKYLRSNNAIIPLIFYVHSNKLKEIDMTSKNSDLMRKYLYSVLLNGVFGGQTDSLLRDSRNIIKSNQKNLFPLEELFKAFSNRNKIVRRGDDLKELIEDIKYNTDKSKLILSIIYGNSLPKEFQEDHMFPRSKMLKKYDKNIVDNIANIQALGRENQIKSNKSFENWLNEKERSEDYLEIHLVPKMQKYEDDEFLIFLEKRREKILNKVKDFFQ